MEEMDVHLLDVKNISPMDDQMVVMVEVDDLSYSEQVIMR